MHACVATSYTVLLLDRIFSTPRTCARGKVIGLSVVVIGGGTKISRAHLLGISACYKHNESVDIGEKLVSIHFKLLNVAHKHY